MLTITTSERFLCRVWLLDGGDLRFATVGFSTGIFRRSVGTRSSTSAVAHPKGQTIRMATRWLRGVYTWYTRFLHEVSTHLHEVVGFSHMVASSPPLDSANQNLILTRVCSRFVSTPVLHQL